MLRAEHLHKEFGSNIAVDDVTLSLREGELFGFLGPNGAGKTTTIRLMAGLLTPSSGRVWIGDEDLQRNPIQAKRLLGYVPDRPLVYEKLTGREFVRFMAELYELPKGAEAIADKWFADFDLRDAADSLISTYSHGMKQKISLIGQLVHRPKVLLLDEPTVGLDPKGARTLRNALRRFCDEGLTILISTHLLPVAEMMCDRVGIMDKGRLIAQGTISELQSAYQTDAGLEDLFLRLTDGEKGDAPDWT